MHLLYVTDDSYVPHVATTMVSVFENNPNMHFFVHLLATDISKSNEEKLNWIIKKYSHQLDIKIINPQELDINLSICGHWGIFPSLKLYAADLFPDIKSILYMDADMICINSIQALEEINKFRIQEGKALIKDICHRIELIQELSAQVPQFEVKRVEVIRQKLQEKINEWTDIQNIDENRLEQEIIYYLEKLDITEEKVRLANHCKYFLETIEHEDAPGRKIGFIAQEIGREINTMGSKANDHDIQKLVVKMKDELEKIKEQSLNVL